MPHLFRYFLRLGATGFGGPIALVGRIEQDLVEARAWFTAEEFRRGLAFAQVAPGPLAAQLAIYLGWLRGGIRGATLAGFAFVLPSFLIVLALAAAYTRAGELPWMRAAFYGVGAAVIGLIARSAVRLLVRTLPRTPLPWGLAMANALVVALTGRELVSVVLLTGAVALAARWPSGPARRVGGVAVLVPVWLLGSLAVPVAGGVVLELFLYFANAGAVVFGSGLAIVPFLWGGVVGERGWLTETQFLDAVAVAMLTPGPVVITVAFIGWLVAGPLGATAAAVGVFLPVWLVTVVAAPFYERVMASASLRAFAEGVTAAATGALAGAVVVLGRRAITDLPTVLVALAALVLPLIWKRAPDPLVLTLAAVVGLVVAG